MQRRKSQKRNKKTIGITFLIISSFLYLKNQNNHEFENIDQPINVTIIDDNKEIKLDNISAKTIADVLNIYSKNIQETDKIFPEKNSNVFFNDVIKIKREKTINLTIGDEKKELKTYGDTLENIILENNIDLDEDDVVVPSRKTLVEKNLDAEVVKVEIKEEIKKVKIPFETVEKTDDSLSFLKKVVKTEGENGEKEIVYQVSYHNGEEVERKKKEEKITKDPVDKVIVQGTQVNLGKKHTGQASWYAYTGTMSAANQWLPKGSYVKVTNKANGKSVIVQINDRGPFVEGRIIDLDKVAFEKIASLGAGVIDVKMEEINE